MTSACAGLATFNLPAIAQKKSASEKTADLSPNQQSLIKILTSAPGGPGVDKESYINVLGKKSEFAQFHYDISDVSMMSAEQVQSILKIINFIYDPLIRADLWLQVQEDLLDTSKEAGGLIVDRPERPFVAIRSDVVGNIEYVDKLGNKVTVVGSKNGLYKIPRVVLDNTPHIGEYHLHATVTHGYDKSGYGPSVSRAHWIIHGLGGDLGHSLDRIIERGSTHQLVVTLTTPRSDNANGNGTDIKKDDGPQGMNFHYYGGHLGKDDQAQIFICNIGTFYNDTYYEISK